jgi:hypothetical protein
MDSCPAHLSPEVNVKRADAKSGMTLGGWTSAVEPNVIQLPIVHNGSLVGMVSRADVMRYPAIRLRVVRAWLTRDEGHCSKAEASSRSRIGSPLHGYRHTAMVERVHVGARVESCSLLDMLGPSWLLALRSTRFRSEVGGKLGGNHSDRRRISATSSELAPEHVSAVASQGGCGRTAANDLLEVCA